MKKNKPGIVDADNPEWTKADFTRSRPASDMLPADIVAKLVRPRGRPVGSISSATKRQVTLRLDPDVIDKFKATGPGWQSRINEVLRKAG
jgi:uncharacterized protein (DUF4415 family)